MQILFKLQSSFFSSCSRQVQPCLKSCLKSQFLALLTTSISALFYIHSGFLVRPQVASSSVAARALSRSLSRFLALALSLSFSLFLSFSLSLSLIPSAHTCRIMAGVCAINGPRSSYCTCRAPSGRVGRCMGQSSGLVLFWLSKQD